MNLLINSSIIKMIVIIITLLIFSKKQINKNNVPIIIGTLFIVFLGVDYMFPDISSNKCNKCDSSIEKLTNLDNIPQLSTSDGSFEPLDISKKAADIMKVDNMNLKQTKNIQEYDLTSLSSSSQVQKLDDDTTKQPQSRTFPEDDDDEMPSYKPPPQSRTYAEDDEDGEDGEDDTPQSYKPPLPQQSRTFAEEDEEDDTPQSYKPPLPQQSRTFAEEDEEDDTPQSYKPPQQSKTFPEEDEEMSKDEDAIFNEIQSELDKIRGDKVELDKSTIKKVDTDSLQEKEKQLSKTVQPPKTSQQVKIAELKAQKEAEANALAQAKLQLKVDEDIKLKAKQKQDMLTKQLKDLQEKEGIDAKIKLAATKQLTDMATKSTRISSKPLTKDFGRENFSQIDPSTGNIGDEVKNCAINWKNGDKSDKCRQILENFGESKKYSDNVASDIFNQLVVDNLDKQDYSRKEMYNKQLMNGWSEGWHYSNPQKWFRNKNVYKYKSNSDCAVCPLSAETWPVSVLTKKSDLKVLPIDEFDNLYEKQTK